MHRSYFVYILSSDSYHLYIGITNNLERRLWEHRNGTDPNSYSHRHNINRLVYFEETTDARSAIQREKILKRFPRQKKLELIERANLSGETYRRPSSEQSSAPSASLRESLG
jgi:putative endonuclease